MKNILYLCSRLGFSKTENFSDAEKEKVSQNGKLLSAEKERK